MDFCTLKGGKYTIYSDCKHCVYVCLCVTTLRLARNRNFPSAVALDKLQVFAPCKQTSKTAIHVDQTNTDTVRNREREKEIENRRWGNVTIESTSFRGPAQSRLIRRSFISCRQAACHVPPPSKAHINHKSERSPHP